MKKLIYIIICSLIVGNCNIKSIEEYHGVANLDSKQKKLIISKSNKNDIIDILGPPSTKSLLTNNLWIYIENKKTKSSLFKLGKNRVEANNVLVLEIDKFGILKDKKIYNKDDQKKILFTKNTTTMSEKDTFVYGVFSSLRQKIDSPKRKRNKK
tara:strand:- start:113 stop:574 length:462 start_codon:yes stop_codon:yes gene_type:complete